MCTSPTGFLLTVFSDNTGEMAIFQDILLQKAYGAVPTNQTALFAKDGKETCADQLQFCITSIVLRREKAFRKELKITSSKSVLVERSHVGSLLVMCRSYQKLPKVK